MSNDKTRLVRTKRTPFTEAMAISKRLGEFLAKPLSKRSLSSNTYEYDFIQKYIVPIKEQSRPEEMEEKFSNLVDTTDVEKIPTLLVACSVCAMYTIKAMLEYKRGNNDIAWTYVSDANFWLGVLWGGESENKINNDIKRLFSSMGKKGASARYAPNAALKEWVISRYQEGSYPSANKAASALKEAAIAHGRTIGAVLSEENAQRTLAEWIRSAASR